MRMFRFRKKNKCLDPAQLAVHVGYALFIFEIVHRTNAAQDKAGIHLLGEVDRQRVVRHNPYARLVLVEIPDCLQPFLQREMSTFRVVDTDRNNDLVHQLEPAAYQRFVPDRERIERSGEKSDPFLMD